jgi:subtilisin family serine protease
VSPRTLLVAALAALILAAPARAASGPVVAVIDSGVDLTHPALRGHLWTNPGEIPGNGRDDDGDGIVDDVHGADFIDHDGDPADPRGHGTHVAGIVARAGTGPQLGAATGAQIMALRVIRGDGVGPVRALVRAIRYAVAHGARVINLSLAYYGPAPSLEAALRRASAAGVLVDVAAGNDGENLDRDPVYPGSFRTPGMIVVGAADRRGRMVRWSARSRTRVDLVAPGVDVRSSLPGGRYGRLSGTSQATAEVTRVAVRLLSADPAATMGELRAAILAGTDLHPALRRETASGGALDLVGALHTLLG